MTIVDLAIVLAGLLVVVVLLTLTREPGPAHGSMVVPEDLVEIRGRLSVQLRR